VIFHLDPARLYTNRSYLLPWLEQDTLVVTDNDFENHQHARHLLSRHPVTHRVYDITHNPFPNDQLDPAYAPVLTSNFRRWYDPVPGHVFFPIFPWMFSTQNSQWWQPLKFDASADKTKEIMCLNYNSRDHRTQLWAEFNRRQIIHRMVYSFRDPGPDSQHAYPYPLLLPDDDTAQTELAMGVEHPVYDQSAVNLVTETSVDVPFISEKTCKPFMARQIPIVVAAPGISQFLQDIGLDMFGDLVPWSTWDHQADSAVRVGMTAEFVDQWIRSGTILKDYETVRSRVEKNKAYFHSQKFVNTVMCQMHKFRF
jgi:hypothetical protein